MPQSILDRHFDGFESVQECLRAAIAAAICKTPIRPQELCRISRVAIEVLGAIQQRKAYVTQDILENLSFPLRLIPNVILPVKNFGDKDLKLWQHKLVTNHSGFVAGTGALSSPSSAGLPTQQECETTIVLLALEEMDAVIAEKKAQQGGGKASDR